jgi:hypothetical protein
MKQRIIFALIMRCITQDEENNYYSLGGDRHEDLEEENQ